MGVIADRLRNKLNQIKIECDKNDREIAEAFELLNEIKTIQERLEIQANYISMN